MNLDTARVAMLHQDPHPAHRGFTEAINADLIDYQRGSPELLRGTVAGDVLSGLSYPEYDVYLVEGSRPLYAALIQRLTSGGKLVYLCADHGLYQLGRPEFSGDSAVKSLIGKFGTPLVRSIGHRGIDGVVAVSEFAKEYTRPVVGSSTPIEIAHPFIQSDTYQTLAEVSPDYDTNVAVTIGRAWDYKGVDTLVDSWPRVRSSVPDAELHVVGKGHPEKYAQTPGVKVRGFVENLADAFSPASLFVQPSRVDAFPVSTLEAMRGGVPPLVTRTTGTRSEAQKIDSSLVVEPDGQSLAEGITAYFRRKTDHRHQLGARARERSERFDSESRKAAFRDAFRSVLTTI